MKPIIILLLMFLTSCASLQEVKNFHAKGEVEKTAMKEIENIPSVIQVEIPEDAFTLKDISETLPDDLNTDISVSFKDIDIKTLVEHLSTIVGINFIFTDTNRDNTKENKDKNRISINYTGKLKDFLQTLSLSSGYNFKYKNGAIVMSGAESYSVVVPQHPELLKDIEDSLKKIGAADISYDTLTSQITFSADYNTIKKIEKYLNSLKENAALITLRIVLVNVKLTGEKNLGIDWTKLMFNYGKLKQTSSTTQTTTPTTGTGTIETGAVVTTTGSYEKGIGILSSITGASLLLDAKNFTMSSFFNFIESYGNFNVIQNVFLETVNGKKATIEVVTETPYVKSVAISPYITTSASGAATTATTTLSQAQTDTAKTGVVMTVTPTYNAKTKVLGIDLDTGVHGVVKFVDLSAGQLGVLTQPETTKKAVKTYIRMKADNVAIIGGLTYERNNNSIKGLPIDTYLTKTKQSVIEKEELVILLKPTVIEFVAKK